VLLLRGAREQIHPSGQWFPDCWEPEQKGSTFPKGRAAVSQAPQPPSVLERPPSPTPLRI